MHPSLEGASHTQQLLARVMRLNLLQITIWRVSSSCPFDGSHSLLSLIVDGSFIMHRYSTSERTERCSIGRRSTVHIEKKYSAQRRLSQINDKANPQAITFCVVPCSTGCSRTHHAERLPLRGACKAQACLGSFNCSQDVHESSYNSILQLKSRVNVGPKVFERIVKLWRRAMCQGRTCTKHYLLNIFLYLFFFERRLRSSV